MPIPRRSSAAQAGTTAREVAIVVEAATSFSRGVLRGVSQWMVQQSGWLITVDDRKHGPPIPEWLLGWSGDGMISGLPERALPRISRGGRRPVVHVRDCQTTERLPGIHPDDVAVVTVTDDDALCDLATPAVTSVTHDRVRLFSRALSEDEVRVCWQAGAQQNQR